MSNLFIESKEDTPKISFDIEQNKFEISQRSLPENAIEFYEPILSWLNTNLETIEQKVCFDFRLDYFNTASAKQIAKLLILLEKFSEHKDIVVRWFYNREDYDMLTQGSRYSKLINVKFDFIEY